MILTSAFCLNGFKESRWKNIRILFDFGIVSYEILKIESKNFCKLFVSGII